MNAPPGLWPISTSVGRKLAKEPPYVTVSTLVGVYAEERRAAWLLVVSSRSEALMRLKWMRGEKAKTELVKEDGAFLVDYTAQDNSMED